jgi:mannose-6-phosphate isomerase
LHIQESLDVTDYDRGPVDAVTPTMKDNQQQLVDCDKFELRRIVGGETSMAGDDRCHLVSIIDGKATLTYEGCEMTLDLGQTVLLPAKLNRCELKLDGATALWMSPPT